MLLLLMPNRWPLDVSLKKPLLFRSVAAVEADLSCAWKNILCISEVAGNSCTSTSTTIHVCTVNR